MSKIIHYSALTEFITKKLDTTVWSVFVAKPDKSINDRFMIILKSDKPTELYNELIGDYYFINKDEFVCGLINPSSETMRVIMHTRNMNELENLTTLKYLAISHYEAYPGTQLVHSYIPEKIKDDR